MLHSFSRTEILIGREGLDLLKKSKVAVFGVGGVGSFAAEALARCGVGNIVLVDHDDVCITNINRQIHATTGTVGKPKVEVMKERILEINPDARVTAVKRLYSSESSEQLLHTDYDYVIDAIDMVSSKIELIVRCSSMNIRMISSMGAGNKLDPRFFRVADIYETSVCPLARVMRRELKRRNIQRLKVVYSTESPVKQRMPGSVSFVPPVAGLIAAGEAVRDLIGYSGNK